ncbi:HYC_CC_PP family protein [Niastella vici]
MHLHYCMEKLASWKLFDHGSKDCALCRMPKKADNKNKHCITAKSGCCKDEHNQIKTDKDQKVTQSEFRLSKMFPHALVVHHPMLPDNYISSFAIEYSTANVPPLLRSQKLSKQTGYVKCASTVVT